MSTNVGKLEDEAIRLMRSAAKDRLPLDVGYPAKLAKVVREAYAAGCSDTASVIADAYVLYILDQDDLDAFRDALTEYLPSGWKARVNRKARRKAARTSAR